MFHQNPATLVQLLEWRSSSSESKIRSQNQADQKAYIFLGDGINESASLTYRQLNQKAKAIAGYLQSIISKGDRAILLYPSGLEFITAFFGCLYAGVIAVPAYPPRANRSIDRIKVIIENSQAQVLLTTESVLSNLKKRTEEIQELKTLHWCATDTLSDEFSNQWQEININQDDVAFL